MERLVPPYFDYLIEGFHRGGIGRFVHLGHWDEPPSGGTALPFEAAQQRLNDIVLEMVALRDGQEVLDVGCGFGGTLAEINKRFHRMRLVGVNIDPRQLDICGELEARNRNELRWIVADACELPFPDASFDCVLCIEAMFHFKSRRTFFQEAARVLRPGGALVFSDILLLEAREEERPEFLNEAALREGYGPWPDLWGEDADHHELGAAAGLRCVSEIDATANTQLSHQFTMPNGLDERQDPGDPALRAAMMLRWLHDRGRLRYVYLRFDKPAA